MKLNTHGLKMTGIKTVCHETKELAEWGAGRYNLGLYYDLKEGYLWTKVESVYDEMITDNVYKITNLWDYFSMQSIADMVYRTLVERGLLMEYYNMPLSSKALDIIVSTYNQRREDISRLSGVEFCEHEGLKLSDIILNPNLLNSIIIFILGGQTK